MAKLEGDLSHIASERKVWEAKLLDKYGLAASTTTAQKSFLEKRLQWSSVVAWAKSSWRRHSGRKAHVLRKEVRHMEWSGKIPSAACITAIKGSPHTKARMMYFINNFRLQDYEGPRQLVIVYHQQDDVARELVQLYADGTFIKGVAVGGDDAFPSTAALRYGAWSSDADIVAQWDFDQWHDPSRLSMQIRALASSSRPACVIKPWYNNTIDDESDDTSILGERSWMDKHWHPLLGYEVEHAVLDSAQAFNLVEIDMQNQRLASNISHIDEVFDESSQPQAVATLSNTETHSWNISECLAYDQADDSTDHIHELEKDVGDKIGLEMRKQFQHLMTRRHDVTQKLQLLCLQSSLESNAEKQAFMWRHVDQMSAIRAQLDKHIAGITNLLESS